MTDNCYYRLSVRALIFNESKDKFLMIQEQCGKWQIPGGGLEHGENPVKALQREITEETGLVIIRVNQSPNYFYTSTNKEGVWSAHIVYEVEVKDLNFKKSQECVDAEFRSVSEIEESAIFQNVKDFIQLLKSHGKQN